MKSLPVLEGWPWLPDKCPADLQFVEWLDTQGPSSVIFHMGTGLHHFVGASCADKGMACIGLTASKEEVLSLDKYYPEYQVMLGNIYDIDTRLLPEFTIMTLFHLGELVNLYGPIEDSSIRSLIRKVVPGGYVLFYKGSSAWDRAMSSVDVLLNDLLNHTTDYKDLFICRKRA